jgi:predicted nucleotidyltransferase
VRAEVLRLLFAEEGRELHLRELTRQSGLTLGTLQTEVEKLCSADLLLSRRDGNRRYFQANAAHPLFTDLRQLVLKTSGLREVLIEALRDLDGVELAFVFGSLAAGIGKAGSDVDLLIIGDVGLRALAPRLRKATGQLGREINPVTMTAAEFVQGRVKNPFLGDVLAKEKLFIKGTADELARLA